MKRELNHSAMPASGFVEPWSATTGGQTQAFISCRDPHAAIRIVSIDRDDQEVMGWDVARHDSAFSVRSYELGSWIALPALAADAARLVLDVEFLLTKNDEAKTIAALGNLRLRIDETGNLSAVADGVSQVLGRLANERWYRLRLERTRDRAVIEVTTASGRAVTRVELGMPLDGAAEIAIGSDGSAACATLNGRIGHISLEADDRRYSWRFPARGPVETLASLEDEAVSIAIHNMPTFAVASCRFTSEIHDPRLEPSHFDAIHLHDDDFGGFDWSADLTISIPQDARSGVFAVEITTMDGVERLPFFVRSGQPGAALAFLVPTSTYLAYADERLPPVRYPWHGTDRGHVFSIDNGFLCLYDVHSDVSGVSLTSARRPRATLRDDYHYPLSNSPHLLSVDLQLLKFYAREGIAIDIVTDRDLHDDGLAALTPFRGVLTGSHPEYWSARMMAALHAYLDGGGNLAYLGGNGFYWVVAYQGETMELRRVKSDIWSGRPGEAHMSITGEPGGNWEDRGLHNPQAYLGVTYLIMSFGPSRPYRRLEGSRAAEFGWLFDGVSDEPIGQTGTVLGGAAGYEVDAIVRSEETPKNLVRLATADDFDASFQVRPEVWLQDGEVERETLRCADMTIYRHAGGGQVFCTGSVAWIGALPARGESNDVGTIMKNLAAGFGA